MGDAIFRQNSGILGVGIVAVCGLMSPEQIIGIAELAKKMGNYPLKLTTRQTMIIFVPEEKLGELREGITSLGLRIGVFGEVVRNIKACAGNPNFCFRANNDIFDLAATIQERFLDQPTPRDFKISLAGCYRGCTDPYCADFSAVATGPNRFSILIGGRGGSKKPIIAQEILQDITEQGVVEILDFILKRYRAVGQLRERLCNSIARVGLAYFLPPSDLVESLRTPDEVDDFLTFAGL